MARKRITGTASQHIVCQRVLCISWLKCSPISAACFHKKFANLYVLQLLAVLSDHCEQSYEPNLLWPIAKLNSYISQFLQFRNMVSI